jgi:hypothetical protein
MSYSKNTIHNSRIETLARALRDNKVNYTIFQIGEVMGLGLNDGMWDDEDKVYKLYALETEKRIYIDRMVRTHDCDFDDIIETVDFHKNLIDSTIPIEYYDKYGGYEDCPPKQYLPEKSKWKVIEEYESKN